MEPTAASAEPMMKVTEMTELMRMPISWLISKSWDTARIAMPILVFWISVTSAITSRMVRIGVTMVTILVEAEPICTVSPSHGSTGYCLARPPVTYHIRFCIR